MLNTASRLDRATVEPAASTPVTARRARAVAAGLVGPNLIFSVRNVGYVRAAGDVVRSVVEGLGVGGGHRSMAKGIIPTKAFRQVYGKADRATVRRALKTEMFEEQCKVFNDLIFPSIRKGYLSLHAEPGKEEAGG